MTLKQVVVDSLYYTLIIFCLTICTICFIAAVCELVMNIYSDIHNKYKGDTKTVTEIDDEIKQQIQEKEQREQHKIDTIGKQLFEKKLEKDMVSKGKVTIPNRDGLFNKWSYAYKWVGQNQEELKERGYYTKSGVLPKFTTATFDVYLGEDPIIERFKRNKDFYQDMFED